jgi:hypothetical protein
MAGSEWLALENSGWVNLGSKQESKQANKQANKRATSNQFASNQTTKQQVTMV